MEKSDRNRPMTEAIQIQQAVLDKLRQLPLQKQQEVLIFVDSLHEAANIKSTTKSTASLSL